MGGIGERLPAGEGAGVAPGELARVQSERPDVSLGDTDLDAAVKEARVKRACFRSRCAEESGAAYSRLSGSPTAASWRAVKAGFRDPSGPAGFPQRSMP